MATSSTKRAAKLAQKKGAGQRIRFQGGIVFPLSVAIVLIVGIGLILYGRATVPDADASPPTIDDHWHAAYGFYLCDGWVQLNGNLEERNSQGQFTNVNFLRTGIHSHDDGVMHWHPYTSRATGRNAVLDVFLESYEVDLSDDAIRFSSLAAYGPNDEFLDQAPSERLQEYVEGETQCDGEDAEVTVKAWGSFTDTDNGNRYIANMGDVHLDNDGMVFGIYFTVDGADQPMPPWAADLPALGALDTAQLRPEDLESLLQSDTGTTVAGDTTGTTVAGDTSDSGTTATTVAGDTSGTEPSTTDNSVATTDSTSTPDTTDGG